MNWRGMSEDVLEASFNPRVASSDAAGSLERYARRSAAARAQLATRCDATENLCYGSTPKQSYDLYRNPGNQAGAPLVVFIHGGYWRALDKADHSFVVPPLLDAGAVVVNLNYDLCPDVSLDEICAQAIAGVRHSHSQATTWGADPDRMVLIGHSAGAHLAARILNAPADAMGRPSDLVSGVAAISGIYEPQVVLRLPSVNDQAKISEEEANRNDCLSTPPTGKARLVIWAGGDEPQGWIDQSRAYAELAATQGMDCRCFELADTDHFTVLEASFQQGTDAWQAILELLGK